jgi:hypothetical protein
LAGSVVEATCLDLVWGRDYWTRIMEKNVVDTIVAGLLLLYVLFRA